MNKFWKAGLLGALLVAAGVAYGAGSTNVLTSLVGTELVPVDSGTLASDTSINTVTGFVSTHFGNAAIATCSGTTTATCQGQRFIASVTGLTTAAVGVESAAMTVTDASVVAATSIVECNVNIYAGTGDPIATRVTPGTGTVSFTITNVAGSGSLNATVPVACVVF